MQTTPIPLILSDDDEWTTLRPVSWYDPSGFVIVVPSGYNTDLASIPRIVWWLIAPFELSILAPILHDFVYEHKGNPPAPSISPPGKSFTRKQADRLFLAVMRREGVSRFRRTLAYMAVRAFGWTYWNRRGN